MEEQVAATEELIATLIKNTTGAMKEMMQFIKNDTKTPVISNETKDEKKKDMQ